MSTIFFKFASKAKTTLDIGAHVGFYALLAAIANPQGKVVALEPCQRVFERLLRNIELNGVTNVVPLEKAAGSAVSKSAFYHLEGGVPSSSSLDHRFMSQWKTVTSVVQVTTVDDIVESLGLPGVDLVKMDTESTEPDVLKGMLLTLEKSRPVIFCEVLEGWGVERRLEEILSRFGYLYYRLEVDSPIGEKALKGGHNYLFLPSDRVNSTVDCIDEILMRSTSSLSKVFTQK